MDSLNLAEYIRHGMIFKNLATNNLFDAIVYEQFDNPKMETPKNFYVCKHHGSKLASELLAYHHQFDRLLIVIDKTPISSLLPFFEQLDIWKKVIVCNLGTGISGFINKGTPEINDISMLHHVIIAKAEPFDFVSFFTLLEAGHSSYIRISGKEFGGNILQTESGPWEGGYIDLRKYELTWSQGTIVAWGSLANDAIQIIQALPKKYDGFIQTHYFMQPTAELLESIESTQRLIVVGDYAGSSLLWEWRQSILKMNGLGNVSCTMVCPYTQPYSKAVQWTLMELVYEQAEMSVEQLAERLLAL